MSNITRVSIVIQSHLNDARVEMRDSPELAENRIKFVQYLIHTHPTHKEIDAELEWDRYFRD